MTGAIQSVPWWMMVLGFLLVLGPLVTLHELGHYLVGRWFGVKADVFSVGFGKELAGRTDKRGTRWKLSAIPLGGYVQFAGDMNPASQPSDDYLALPEAERNKTFQSKSLWKRTLIVAAGPVANLLIALTIFAAFFMIYGKPVAADPSEENFVVAFAEESAARDAGVLIGDRISAIDGEPMLDFRQIVQAIALYPNRQLEITVEREGAQLTFPMTARASEFEDSFGNKMTVGRIGIQTRPTEQIREPVGPLDSIGLAVQECGRAMSMMVTGIAQIVRGDRSVKELGGPIKIAKFSGEQLSLGWPAFISFAALISLNLAFINLLPIPALDGGHLAFYAVEAVRRKPASPRAQEWAFRTGVAFVLALMVFVTVIDIASLPIFGS